MGTDTNTDGYEPCTEQTVTVAVTDECPGGSALIQLNQSNALTGHCGGNAQHFDLSTKAFKIIGNENAGVLNIAFRRVSCAAPKFEVEVPWDPMAFQSGTVGCAWTGIFV